MNQYRVESSNSMRPYLGFLGGAKVGTVALCPGTERVPYLRLDTGIRAATPASLSPNGVT